MKTKVIKVALNCYAIFIIEENPPEGQVLNKAELIELIEGQAETSKVMDYIGLADTISYGESYIMNLEIVREAIL